MNIKAGGKVDKRPGELRDSGAEHRQTARSLEDVPVMLSMGETWVSFTFLGNKL